MQNIRRFVTWTQRLAPALIAGLALGFTTQSVPAHAYEEDTHYQLTYVMCRCLGFTQDEALTVARYDQGMDDSDGTVAVTGATPHITAENLWHAIPMPTGFTFLNVDAVLDRKDELWNEVLYQPTRERQLEFLGVFLHYQQDTWAHRHHENSSYEDFDPFTAPDGHLAYWHQPDRPPFDPVCAVRCLEDSIRYGQAFMTQVLKRTPNAVFKNYTPATVAKDESWNLRGELFNEVTGDTSTEAHRIVTDLIRAQIDAYTSSRDWNYWGYWTANQADYSTTRQHFMTVCADDGISINIPVARIPLTTLTTAGLEEEAEHN
jgi:hypothetical protein